MRVTTKSIMLSHFDTGLSIFIVFNYRLLESGFVLILFDMIYFWHWSILVLDPLVEY